MFHVKRNGDYKMICVSDFCNACGEGVDVNISFYNSSNKSFICHVVLYDANKSYKTLSASYAYASIEKFYTVADLTCCEAYV